MQTNALYHSTLDGDFLIDDTRPEVKTIPAPGRPEKPELVNPNQVKQRKLTTTLGQAVLIHAIAHIEFNAINLALAYQLLRISIVLMDLEFFYQIYFFVLL